MFIENPFKVTENGMPGPSWITILASVDLYIVEQFNKYSAVVAHLGIEYQT